MKILIVEDDSGRKESFRRVINTFDSLTLCVGHRYADIEAFYKSIDFDLILLDHDLGDEIHDLNPVDGLYIVRNIICKKPVPAKYIIVHSHNSYGSECMIDDLKKHCGDNTLLYRAPFGERCLKLLVSIMEKLNANA